MSKSIEIGSCCRREETVGKTVMSLADRHPGKKRLFAIIAILQSRNGTCSVSCGVHGDQGIPGGLDTMCLGGTATRGLS